MFGGELDSSKATWFASDGTNKPYCPVHSSWHVDQVPDLDVGHVDDSDLVRALCVRVVL